MGGCGSGRHAAKATADTSLRIDFAWMLRTGRAKEGSWRTGRLSWYRCGDEVGSIDFQAIMHEPGFERLELSFSIGSAPNQERERQIIPLCHTVPHFGGKRWWMLCPVRHVRVGKLYLPRGGDRFASRYAWGLAYQCQRDAARDRPFERLFRLQKKLGGEQRWGGGLQRPKGMWHRTFDRHLERYWELDDECAAEMLAITSRLSA